MISYSLICENEHKFDAWFGSADAYEAQQQRGIVTCPICDSRDVHKALMAPAVSRSGSEKVALSIGHPQHAQLQAAMHLMTSSDIAGLYRYWQTFAA